MRSSEHVVPAGVHQRRLLLRKAAPQHEHQAPAVRAERTYRRIRDRLPPCDTRTPLVCCCESLHGSTAVRMHSLLEGSRLHAVGESFPDVLIVSCIKAFTKVSSSWFQRLKHPPQVWSSNIMSGDGGLGCARATCLRVCLLVQRTPAWHGMLRHARALSAPHSAGTRPATPTAPRHTAASVPPFLVCLLIKPHTTDGRPTE